MNTLATSKLVVEVFYHYLGKHSYRALTRRAVILCVPFFRGSKSTIDRPRMQTAASAPAELLLFRRRLVPEPLITLHLRFKL